MSQITSNFSLAKFFAFVLSASLFLGFYLNEDSSSGGVSTDFYTTWGYIEYLKENLFVNSSWLDGENWTRVLPLHYIFVSQLDIITPNIEIVDDQRDLARLLFCFISLSIPILFYLNLKIKFPNISKNLLLYLAFIILIIPYFRSSAIWANSHITALIFFLLSILFYLKWEKKKNYSKLEFNLILQTFFLALAVYTRQNYAIFFIYYFFIYFQRLKFITFIKISSIIFVLSLPGFWLIYEYPFYFTESTFNIKFYNTLLINSSMMFVYLLPIFLLLIVRNPKFFIAEKYFFTISFASSFFATLLMLIFFDYDPSYGGGFFLKLSNFLFENNFIFYFSSLLGFVSLSYISKESINNFILIVLIFLSFSVLIIMQKWFEPTFLFLFFLIFNSRLPSLFLGNHKNLIFMYLYFLLYLTSAVINDFYQIGPNL